MRVLATHKAANRLKTTIQSGMLNLGFPDGLMGAITISKIVQDHWDPSKDIESITINWK